MSRQIKLYYEISVDNKRITIEITDESGNSISRYVDEYAFNSFKDSTDFYNTMLEKYDAEYDDAFAEVLDKLSNKLKKEGYFND